MWIQYVNQHTKEKKKFNLSSNKLIPRMLEDSLGSGQFCWLVDDKKYQEQEAKSISGNKENSLLLAGYAILIEDPFGKIKYWATFNGEGKEHVNLSPAQPLLFPVGKLKTGTRVELYIPKD